MADGFKIVIGADVQEALAGLNKVNTGLKTTDNFADQVAASSKSLSQALDQLGKKGQLSINSLGLSIKDFRSLMQNATNTGDIKKFGDAISVLTAKQKELIQSVGSKDIFGQAFSGLRQLANILPGFGIAGLLGAAANGITTLAESIVNDLAPTSSILSDFNEKFAETAAGNIASIELLKAKINDSNTSQAQRVELVKDYNKEADKQNQIDTTQAGNLDAINSKINQQIKLLEQRAAVRAAEGFVAQKFEALFNKQLEFKLQFPDLEKEQGDIIFRATKFIDNVNAKLKITPTFDTKELLSLSDLPVKQLQDLAKQGGKFQIFSDSNAVETLKRFNTELNSSIALTKNLGQAGVFEKMKSDIAAAQKDVDDTLALFSKLLDVQGFSTESKEKLAKAFEGIKVGIVKGLNSVQDLIELNPHTLAIPFQVALAEGGPLKDLQFSEVKEQLDDALNQFALRESVVPIEIQKQIHLQLKDVKIDASKLGQDLNKSVESIINQTLVNLDVAIGEAIGNALTGTGTIEDAFKSVFTILSEGVSALGKKLIEIGVLAEGFQVAIESLATQPELAIALGVALVALSQAMKNSFRARADGGPVQQGFKYLVNERGREIFQPNHGQARWIEGGMQFFTPDKSGYVYPASLAKAVAGRMNIKGFQNGGLISSPTFALIGEGAGISKSNPEVVAPLSELRGMLGMGNAFDLSLNIRDNVRGNNLTRVLNRQYRRNNRLT